LLPAPKGLMHEPSIPHGLALQPVYKEAIIFYLFSNLIGLN